MKCHCCGRKTWFRRTCRLCLDHGGRWVRFGLYIDVVIHYKCRLWPHGE